MTNSQDDVEFEMLQALYDFTGTVAQTLSFERDECFIFHSSNNLKKNWWNVINKKGKHGYIPSNYVQIIKVNRDAMCRFIDGAMEGLGMELAQEGRLADRQMETMQELIGRKQSVQMARSLNRPHHSKQGSGSKPSSKQEVNSGCNSDHSKKRMAPSPPPPNSGAASPSISASQVSHAGSENSIAKPASSSGDGSVKKLNNQVDSVTFISRSVEENQGRSAMIRSPDISDQHIYLLVQQVRDETGLSFNMSKLAVGVVAEGLLSANCGNCPTSETVLIVTTALSRALNVSPDVLIASSDATLLNQALSHLSACKDDAQQRSWQLWDDQHTILTNIATVQNILDNADPEICRLVVKSCSYQAVSMLVEYYQMEERWIIRDSLVSALTVLCSLDSIVISIILNSVLPMEVAREMEANMDNIDRITKLASLLTVAFSTGEAMPITHLEHLGVDFISNIVRLAETNEDLEDVMLTLLLSYNLQFKPQSVSNITVQALNRAESVKVITEKLLLLINREADPVVETVASRQSNGSVTYHSVLKLFMDLLSCEAAAKLFYTNDMRVLVDIISRQLCDLPPHSEKRTEYLGLCKLILLSCDKVTYEHKIGELKERFNQILTEESPPVETDRLLVRQIIDGLPDLIPL